MNDGSPAVPDGPTKWRAWSKGEVAQLAALAASEDTAGDLASLVGRSAADVRQKLKEIAALAASE
jgi:hypothetical protein